MKSIYLIGALKNWGIPQIANEIEKLGIEVFADWITPGPEADTFLLKYAKERGWNYEKALNSHAANHVFEFDKSHLDRCDAALAVAPFGKSAMLELGYTIGKGKPGYIYFPKEPERFDVMLKFATKIFFDKNKLFAELRSKSSPQAYINVAVAAEAALRSRQAHCAHKFIDFACGAMPQQICLLCHLRIPKPGAPVRDTRCPVLHTWSWGEISRCQLYEGHSLEPYSKYSWAPCSGHRFSPSDTIK